MSIQVPILPNPIVREVSYSQGLEDYVKYIPKIMENGANIIGGCCGTDPDYIKRMAEIIKTV